MPIVKNSKDYAHLAAVQGLAERGVDQDTAIKVADLIADMINEQACEGASDTDPTAFMFELLTMNCVFTKIPQNRRLPDGALSHGFSLAVRAWCSYNRKLQPDGTYH